MIEKFCFLEEFIIWATHILEGLGSNNAFILSSSEQPPWRGFMWYEDYVELYEKPWYNKLYIFLIFGPYVLFFFLLYESFYYVLAIISIPFAWLFIYLYESVDILPHLLITAAPLIFSFVFLYNIVLPNFLFFISTPLCLVILFLDAILSSKFYNAILIIFGPFSWLFIYLYKKLFPYLSSLLVFFQELIINNSYIFIISIKILTIVGPVLIAVAYMTLLERKFLASMQKRVGPNYVGFLGLLQPVADAAKLVFKETVLPSGSNHFIFILAPVLTLALSLINWAVIPFGETSVLADIDLGVLYILAVSSLSVYGIILSGWSSNSKYAFLGSIRSAAQMISYEVSIGLILINIFLCVGSFRLIDIVLFQREIWLFIPLFPSVILFFISALAETNRPPFDLPEAEAELVAGYSVEYSAINFALFFIAEYANIILMSLFCVLLFFGGWLSPISNVPILISFVSDKIFSENIPFFIKLNYILIIIPFYILFKVFSDGLHWLVFKTILVILVFIWVRATFPRFRYDQLMRLGWKVFLPLSLAWLIFTSTVLMITGSLPV